MPCYITIAEKEKKRSVRITDLFIAEKHYNAHRSMICKNTMAFKIHKKK
jgi:hypothetical protein